MECFTIKANIAHERFGFIDDPFWFVYSADFSVNIDENLKRWLKENMRPKFWIFKTRWKCRFIDANKDSATLTFFNNEDAALYKLVWR